MKHLTQSYVAHTATCLHCLLYAAQTKKISCNYWVMQVEFGHLKLNTHNYVAHTVALFAIKQLILQAKAVFHAL